MVVLKPGTKLKIKIHMSALSGHEYVPGMILELLEQTEQSAYGHNSPLGNWLVKCPFQTSVWSSIWMLVEQRHIEVVSD